MDGKAVLRTLFGFAAMWLLGSATFPQASCAAALRGRVTDESTGQSLVAASIKVESRRPGSKVMQTLTDSQGRYRINEMPPDSYQVTFSYVGYSRRTSQLLALAPHDTVALDAALVPQAIDMEAMVVSASRRPEKYVEAPAAVTLVTAADMEPTVALSTADHLEKLPSVDASSTGLNSSNVVVRGFNNVLSTTVLTLEDYRIAQIPSLRVNAYQFLTTIDDDVDRMELVEGPGSSLYGPNAATGVLHIITKSPFASRGTSISLAGGERSLWLGSLRHAGTVGDKLGYRLSGQYYSATDWKYYDPVEQDTITLVRQGPDGNQPVSGVIDNTRDFHVKRFNADARLDWVPFSRGLVVFAGGASQASNIELTDLGAAQIRDWRYGYGQVRFTYKNLFAQAYVNLGNSRDSYLRRSGAVLVDDSRFYATQMQHGFSASRRIRLNYGIDAQFTRPDTDSTLHGRNEQRDNVDAVGAYAQADISLSARLAALVAARVDDDNVIEHAVLSPRAGLTYEPGPGQQLRLTFNRAFGTPSPTDLFLDVLSFTKPMPDPVDTLVFGSTLFDVRGAGSVDGFTFRRDGSGRPLMVSLYGGLLEAGGSLPDAESYMDPTANAVWPALRALVTSENPALDPVLPATLGAESPGRFARLNIDTEDFDPIGAYAVQDVRPLEETGTTTIEAGYKGRISARVALGASVYYTHKNDFIGPLRVETPHVFLDSASFVGVLRDDIVDGGMMDSATADSTAVIIYSQFAELPIGLASPEGIQSATDVIMTRRNFGEVDLVGADVSATFHLGPSWGFSGNYSYMSKDLFPNVDGISDIATNAPRHKFGASAQYQSRRRSFEARLWLRWVDGFPVQSGYYIGDVERYVVLNLNLAYRPLAHTEIALTVQNLLDHKHAEFVGAPELGRLAILRLTQRL